VLMGYIDDATGRIYCRFYEYEGTIPATRISMGSDLFIALMRDRML